MNFIICHVTFIVGQKLNNEECCIWISGQKGTEVLDTYIIRHMRGWQKSTTAWQLHKQTLREHSRKVFLSRRQQSHGKQKRNEQILYHLNFTHGVLGFKRLAIAAFTWEGFNSNSNHHSPLNYSIKVSRPWTFCRTYRCFRRRRTFRVLLRHYRPEILNQILNF